MAGELQVSSLTGVVIYFLVRNTAGQAWNTGTNAFEAYTPANYANYAVAATEQGSSGYYSGTFPAGVPAGSYNVVAKRQSGGSPAQGDATVAAGSLEWSGSAPVPLSDLVTSGQIGGFAPLRLARGVQVANFPVYLKSAADHVSPFTSGVVSGQISRDGGAFGPLQSGAFTEVGLGWFALQALTSGDLLANTVALMITAVGISGGTSDPLPMAFVLQRVSGQN